MNFNNEIGTDKADRYIYTVAELTREIKVLLETTIPTVWIQGEISNFTHHSSGHMYFSLKDENAQLSCVMWRTRNASLPFIPQDGMMVLARGRITVYEKRGTYQLDVQLLQPAGVGALQIAFEQLKKQLREQGLFDPENKKPLPPFPERIGIVTSPTGAAIRDLVTVLNRRFPAAEIILRPARVQGDGAAQEIAQAIEEFNEYGKVDVLIVGRGGGSFEDLWAFNEEVVARAIFASDIPVVSAVGHEVDFTIADFVADFRAPTPSAAAEIVVKDRIQNIMSIYVRRLGDRIKTAKDKLHNVTSSYGFRRPQDLLVQFRQQIDELNRSLELAISHKIDFARGVHEQMWRRLRALSPQSILDRGFSICWKPEKQEIVRSTEQLAEGEVVAVHFSQGGIQSTVKQIYPVEQLSDIASNSAEKS